jgi:hypothetical protein
MYDIKTVIASFLRTLQQNFAQSQYFPIHTTKRVVMAAGLSHHFLGLGPGPLILGKLWSFLGKLEKPTFSKKSTNFDFVVFLLSV